MFKRQFLLVLVISLLLVMTIGTEFVLGQQPTGKKYTIAFCIPSFDVSDLYERMYVMAEVRLKELGMNYELILQAVPSTTAYEQQLRQVEAMIAKKVDFLILGSGDPEIAVKPLILLKQAKIPTIMITYLAADIHTEESKATQYVGFKQEDGARLSAASLLYYLGQKYGKIKGDVVMIYGSPGWLTETRGFTMKKILEQFPDIKIVDEHYAYVDRIKSYEYTLDYVRINPDIDVIYAISSSMGLGAAQAVAELGLSDKIAIYGVGGTGEEYESIEKGQMYGSMGRMIDEKGIAIANTIYQVLVEGKSVPQTWAGPWYLMDKVQFDLGTVDENIEKALGRSKKILGR